jgi:hypothetical protein
MSNQQSEGQRQFITATNKHTYKSKQMSKETKHKAAVMMMIIIY